jgi:hypothetical protein
MDNPVLYLLNVIVPLALSLFVAWAFIRKRRTAAGIAVGSSIIFIMSCTLVLLIIRVTGQSCLRYCLAHGSSESACNFTCGENAPIALVFLSLGYWVLNYLLFFGTIGIYFLIGNLVKKWRAGQLES